VTREGDRLRIRAQLTRTADASQIWSHDYDTQFRDLIPVQQNMARSIADDMQASRSSQTALIPPGSTTDAEAHDLYLQGQQAATSGTAQGIQKAVPLMRAALARDSHYAAPWFALAKMTETLGYLAGWTPALADEVRADLNHALQLDPKMAAAHADLGYFDWAYDYNWDRAEREFQLALQEGNHAEPHKLYAMSLADRGRFVESHQHLRIAEELAPLDPELLFFEGGVLAWERRFPEAEQKYQSMLRMVPKAPAALAALAYIKTWEKDCAGGSQFESRLMAIAPNDYRTASVRFALMVCRGDRTGALQLLGSDPAKLRQLPLIEMAQGYAYLGDVDTAVRMLEEAVEHHALGATSMKQSPYFDNLRGDAHFMALEKRVGLMP
jgi:tetratricopeptide (TPR) repeat protein